MRIVLNLHTKEIYLHTLSNYEYFSRLDEEENIRKTWQAAVAQWVESSALDRGTLVRDSPSEKPSCRLMAPGACKIRRGCNALQVPIQIISLSGKARHSVADQICNGMSPDHSSG